MSKPRLLDLFTGSGSVAKVAKELGYEVVTLDIDPRCKPTIVADVLYWDYRVFAPNHFDVIWCSIPCETFSAARRSNIGRKVKGEIMTPETLTRDTEQIGVPILRKTQEILEYLNPKVWFIENPYSGSMKSYIEQPPTVFDYCMFGFGYRKRTAIWSNQTLRNCLCDKSHLVNGRHAQIAIGSNKHQQGQGGGSSKHVRYAIPRDLLVYLLPSVNNLGGKYRCPDGATTLTMA